MIIKCPECGHQISDRAPTCPSCGVEIAGKVTRCPDCGEVYFSDEDVCPRCHRPTHEHSQVSQPAEPPHPLVAPVLPQKGKEAAPEPAPVAPKEFYERNKKEDEPKPPTPKPKKKSNKTALIVSIIIALLVCGVIFYLHKQAEDQKEMEEYKIALNNEEPLILQQYLDTFGNTAPQEHLDSIQARLEKLKSNDKEWENTLASNSRDAFKTFLSRFPNSPHKSVALNKIDSIDWAHYSSLKTEEAYKAYMSEHPDGEFYADAEDAVRKLKVNVVSDEEKAIVSNVLHNFFVSINGRDESRIVSTVAVNLTLLDKQNATNADVIEMMNKQYKEGTTAVTWRLPGKYDIKKREIGDAKYEYTTSFTATKDVESSDASQKGTKQYRVTAKVNPDGKISLLKLSQVTDQPKAEETQAEKPKADKPKAEEKPKATEKPKTTTEKPKTEKTEKPAEKKEPAPEKKQ